MKAGQRLTAPDGYQVCLYPLPILYVIQASPSPWSHCCGYPIDVHIQYGGTTYETLYAPCDCEFYYQDTVGNSCAFISSNKVHTPRGLSYVCFQFTHGRLLGKGATQGYGAKYKQGEPIYTTGLDNAAGVNHCHIDQCFTTAGQKVYMYNTGMVCQIGWACWVLRGSCPAPDVFFVNDTTIRQAGAVNGVPMQWKTWTKGGSSTVNPSKPNENPSLKWIIPVVKGAEYTRSDWLTWEQSLNNARCFYGEMHARGFSLNAICGILGNCYLESQVNPNCWQDNYIGANTINYEGFGLVQWTPYTNCTDWLKEKGYWGKFAQYGTAECTLLEWEFSDQVPHDREQWYPTAGYNMSKEQFKKSTADVTYLTRAFHYNYERGGYSSGAQREAKAVEFYNYLKGLKPELPDGAILDGDYSPIEPEVPTSGKKKKWLYWLRPWWKK